ncbi:MAG: protoporphyrinogen oxidase, partial [Opitutales bacterium]
APVMRHLAHWPRAIPQYKIGYGHYLETITDAETRYPGFEIMSNYRNGISLSYCLEAAIAAKI